MLAENNKMGRIAVLAVGVIFVVIGFMGDKPIENRLLTLLVGAIFFVASRYAKDTSFEGTLVLDEDQDGENEAAGKSSEKIS